MRTIHWYVLQQIKFFSPASMTPFCSSTEIDEIVMVSSYSGLLRIADRLLLQYVTSASSYRHFGIARGSADPLIMLSS